jgi:hypothetical protein
MAALGDERLFATLEASGAAIANGDTAAVHQVAGGGGACGVGEGGRLGRGRPVRGWRSISAIAACHRGGRLRSPAPRRGGGVRLARRRSHRRGSWRDARRSRNAHRAPARQTAPRHVADGPGSSRGARIHVDRQEARRRGPALGAADRRRPRDRCRGPPLVAEVATGVLAGRAAPAAAGRA